MDATPDLTAAMERAIVRELAAEWQRINAAYFREALRQPAIELSTHATLGRWVAATRTIEIARKMVLEQAWGAVLEVLKHEMAHQYVHERLGAHDETAHGPAFRDVCAKLGIDAAASGIPAVKAPDEAEERAVHRIARLLALAESPNQHEAEAAMAAAQRLMLKHNVDALHAGLLARRGYSFRHLGVPTGRTTEAERILASILARHFFVEVIWVPVYRAHEGKRGSVLEICGAQTNLEIAAYVHAFLTQSAERLWEDHKRARAIRSNRDRRTFLAGVMAGFEGKLAREQKRSAAEGLVWVRDGDLHDYFRRRHPHIRNVRYGGTRKNESFEHGKEAGRGIVLRRAIEDANGASRGRLLGPKT